MRAVPPSYNKGNKNTDFVQRPAEVKFDTVFECPKVELEIKKLFLKSHGSHPEKKKLIEERFSTTRIVVKF